MVKTGHNFLIKYQCVVTGLRQTEILNLNLVIFYHLKPHVGGGIKHFSGLLCLSKLC